MKNTIIIVSIFILIFLIISTFVTNALSLNNMNSKIIFMLNRNEVFYLFGIPSQPPFLSFTWTVKTESYAGRRVYIQYSYDKIHWFTLCEKTVDLNGTATGIQIVDSSWARKDENYLRAIIDTEGSNIIVLKIYTNIGYLILAYIILFIFVFISFWKILKRKMLLILEKLQKYIKNYENMLYILFGLLIRILIAPWTEHRFDNYVSRLWCTLIYKYGIYPIEPDYFIGYPSLLRYTYPPIWLFILLSIFPIWLWIGNYKFPEDPTLLWKYGLENNNLFESYRSFVPTSLPFLDLIIKLPNILADIGIAYLFFNLFSDEKYRKSIFFLWIINPYVIYISSVWGAFDALVAFFSFCSFFFLLKKKYIFSAIFLILGIATKLYPVFFFIPFIIFIYKKNKYDFNKSLKYFIIVILGTAFIFCIPLLFLPTGLKYLTQLIIFRASPDWYGRNQIEGLTWLILFKKFELDKNIPIFPMIFIPIYLWLLHSFWFKCKNSDSLTVNITEILLIIYLTYTIINPQYLFWILPFLLYLVLKGKFSKRIFLIISIIPLLQAIKPLYNISPVIVWDENNYLPWSDIFTQLYYYFSIFGNFAPYIFSFISLISLVKITTIPETSFKIEKIYVSGEYKWSNREPDKFTFQRIELIVKNIKSIKPRKILDVGCGSGFSLQKLNGEVKVGVDLSTLALNKIKDENVDRICADAQYLPLKDNVFDAIICGDVLEHIPNLNLAISEIKRVMIDKAFLLVTLPYLIEIINYIYNVITGKSYLNIQHVHRHTLRGWKNIFEKNGFQIVKASPILNLKCLLYILIKREELY